MRRDPESGDPDFFGFARDYLHTYLPKVQQSSPKTIQAYRISLECFLDYLADHEHVERASVSFDHFDRPHLKGWLAWMAGGRAMHPTPSRCGSVPSKRSWPTAPAKTSPSSRLPRQPRPYGLRPSPKSRSSTSPSPRRGPFLLPSTARRRSRAGTGCC